MVLYETPSYQVQSLQPSVTGSMCQIYSFYHCEMIDEWPSEMEQGDPYRHGQRGEEKKPLSSATPKKLPENETDAQVVGTAAAGTPTLLKILSVLPRLKALFR